jgi:putative permease
VPILFAEVMNLHPLAIILAVLLFGSLFGFWGVFFAIPLMALVNVVIKSWPKESLE